MNRATLHKKNELELKERFVVKLKESAVYIRDLNRGVLSIIESTKKLFFVDLEAKKMVSSTMLDDIALNQKLIKIDSKGDYLICVNEELSKVKYVRLIDFHSQIFSSPSDSKICSLDYSSSNSLLFVSCEDGKSYMIEMDGDKSKSVATRHKDTISASALRDDGKVFATASMDRSLSIKQTSTINEGEHIHSFPNQISSMTFYKERYLLCGFKNGDIALVDFWHKNIVMRYESTKNEIIKLEIIEDRFFLALTKIGTLYGYSITKSNNLSRDFLSQNRKYLTFCYDSRSGNLSLVTNDNHVRTYNLKELEEIAKRAIDSFNFKELYRVASYDPFLRYSHPYLSMEAYWEASYSEAFGLLESGLISEANDILRPFVAIPTKRMLIQKVLGNIEIINQLKKAIKDKQFARAYSLASQNPILKETQSFKALEKLYRDHLLKAIEMIKNKNIQMAQKLLRPFASVSEKSKINTSLFSHPESIEDAIKAYNKKEFKAFFAALNHCLAIEYMDVYSSVKNEGEAIYREFKKEYFSGNSKKAISLAKRLLEFPYYKIEAKNALSELQSSDS